MLNSGEGTGRCRQSGVSVSHTARPCRGLGRARNSRYVRADSGWPADQRRLVLPDDWPEDMHPLRKDAMDYRLRPEPTTDSETYAFINEGNSDARVIPVGPLHITSDEPGHFRLFVDGEQIVDADYRLFYVHRGMEKLAGTRMGYNEVTFFIGPRVWDLRFCPQCGLYQFG